MIEKKGSQSMPIIFEKRVFIGIFLQEGVDFSDILQLAQRIEADFGHRKLLSDIDFTINATEITEDESEPKIKIESKDNTVYLWANENMLFFAATPTSEEGRLNEDYRLLLEMIKVPTFKMVKMSGARVTMYAERRVDKSDRRVQQLIKTIFRLPPTDNVPSAASIQYKVDIDDFHIVEHRVEVSELDDDERSEIKYGSIHSFTYKDNGGGDVKRLLEDIRKIKPEEELSDEIRRSEQATVL